MMTTMTGEIVPANPQEHEADPRLYKHPRPEDDPELGDLHPELGDAHPELAGCLREEEEEKNEVGDFISHGNDKQAHGRKSFEITEGLEIRNPEDLANMNSSRIEALTSLDNENRPDLLPEVTPELIREHLKEQAAAAAAKHHDDTEFDTICGIPYYLFMTLAALAAAVTAGTVLAVIYYDPEERLISADTSTDAPLP